MQTILETPRLLFRLIKASDAEAMFEMDSDPEVHLYLGNNPLKHIDECYPIIENLQWQYNEFGMARMAVILKETGEFLGWAGLKRERNLPDRGIFIDLGYRFIQKHWGKGYASEAAQAWVDYGFDVLKLEKINAFIDVDNLASRKVIEKVGLKFIETFDFEGTEEAWYEMKNPNL